MQRDEREPTVRSGASGGENEREEPIGHVDPSQGADMGGTPSHQRASFSDPIAAIADDVAGAVDPDGRVERTAELSEWTVTSEGAAEDPVSGVAESARERPAGDPVDGRDAGPELAIPDPAPEKS